MRPARYIRPARYRRPARYIRPARCTQLDAVQGAGRRSARVAEQPGHARLARERLDRAREAPRADPGVRQAVVAADITTERVDHGRRRAAEASAACSTEPEQPVRASGKRSTCDELCGVRLARSLHEQRRSVRSLHGDIRYGARWLHRSSQAVRALVRGANVRGHRRVPHPTASGFILSVVRRELESVNHQFRRSVKARESHVVMRFARVPIR